MKNRLNEEKNYMKYLFNYKKGVVISEQEDKPTDIFNPSEKSTVTPKPTQLPINTQTNSESQDLETKRKQLQDELSKLNSKLEGAEQQKQNDLKVKTLESLTLELEKMDQKLKESCNVAKWKMTPLCKTWMEERVKLQSQINKLKFVEAETKNSKEKGEGASTASKTQEWVSVITSTLAVISTIIGLKSGSMRNND
jgi:hypothetical protein